MPLARPVFVRINAYLKHISGPQVPHQIAINWIASDQQDLDVEDRAITFRVCPRCANPERCPHNVDAHTCVYHAVLLSATLDVL